MLRTSDCQIFDLFSSGDCWSLITWAGSWEPWLIEGGTIVGERPGGVVDGLGDLEELIIGDFSLVARAFRAVGLGACGLAAKGPVGGGGLVLGASEVTPPSRHNRQTHSALELLTWWSLAPGSGLVHHHDTDWLHLIITVQVVVQHVLKAIIHGYIWGLWGSVSYLGGGDADLRAGAPRDLWLHAGCGPQDHTDVLCITQSYVWWHSYWHLGNSLSSLS